MPRTNDSFVPYKLPLCIDCNGLLEQNFEAEAKLPVLKLLRAASPLDPDETRIAGRWFVKTWLLLAHPKTHLADLKLQKDLPTTAGKWYPPDPSLYDWMITRSSPPSGLSAWLTRLNGESAQAPKRTIYLPTVIADNKTTVFRSFRHGIGHISVDLVYHPDWPIDHPLESEGRAHRLWPAPDAALDVSSLPATPDDEFTWGHMTVHLQPGVYGIGPLPPLRSTAAMDLCASIESFLVELGPNRVVGVDFNA